MSQKGLELSKPIPKGCGVILPIKKDRVNNLIKIMTNELEKDDSLNSPIEEEETSDETPIEPSELKEKLEQKQKEVDGLYKRAKTAEEELKKFKVKPEEGEKAQEPKTPDNLDKIIDEKFEERDLASMDFSDELKSEVRAYAKAKKISYREASKSDYFNFVKGKEDERLKAEEASTSSTGKSVKAGRDFVNLSAGELENLSSEDFKSYKKWLNAQG